MIKKISIYASVLYVLLFASFNIAKVIVGYFTANVTIRESFYFDNNRNQKGTHSGGENYRLKDNEHKYEVLKLKFSDIISSISGLSKIDPQNSNFNKEYEIVSLLYKLSENSHGFKKETAIYIPKDLDAYWDMSCDTHMAPFIAPAIANMAMIEGLPMLNDGRESCYTHLLEYGYNRYYQVGKKAQYIQMTRDEICERAKKEGFVRVIEITENDEVGIVTITHECVD